MSRHPLRIGLAVGAIAAVLTSQSLAGGLQPYQSPTPDYELGLNCTPDVIPRYTADPDPVSAIDVGIRSIAGDVSMQVLHHHLSGLRSDRAVQYRNFAIWQEAGFQTCYWGGQHLRRPNIRMLGTVAHLQNGKWVYLESVDNALTARTEVATKATCSLQDI